jgi:hypothetical protein
VFQLQEDAGPAGPLRHPNGDATEKEQEKNQTINAKVVVNFSGVYVVTQVETAQVYAQEGCQKSRNLRHLSSENTF